MNEIGQALDDGRTISGHCDPRFAGVLAEFRVNFVSRREVGGSLCLTHKGETVVDLWGGHRQPGNQPGLEARHDLDHLFLHQGRHCIVRAYARRTGKAEL